MKHARTPLEDKIAQSGQSYFRSFHRSLVQPAWPKRQPFLQRPWVMPSVLSSVFSVLIVALTLNAITPNNGMEQTLGRLTALNTVDYPSWNAATDRSQEAALAAPLIPFLAQAFSAMDHEDNLVYSPLSSYVTMAMLYEASQGTTQTELQNLLGITSDDALHEAIHDGFQQTYRQVIDKTQPVVQSRLANGIFIRDTFPIVPDYPQRLAETYFAEVFHSDFSEDDQAAIAEWINDKTNDFLNIKPDDLSIQDSTQWLLYNTFYLRANWLTPYEEAEHYASLFTADNGDTMPVMMMPKTLRNTMVFQDEMMTIVQDQAYGDYQFHFILPSESSSVDALLADDALVSFLTNQDERMQSRDVRLHIPAFSIQNKLNLNTWYHERVPSLFTAGVADLSRAGDDLYVQSLTQDARIDVFAEGFEAAAVTEADVGTTSMPVPPNLEIIFDRSFAFYITTASGLITFFGVVHQPQEA